MKGCAEIIKLDIDKMVAMLDVENQPHQFTDQEVEEILLNLKDIANYKIDNTQWVSIKQETPKHSDWYIVTVGANHCVYADYWDAREGYKEWQNYDIDDIIAWKPMPKPYLGG